jgi:hypothetical protein
MIYPMLTPGAELAKLVIERLINPFSVMCKTCANMQQSRMESGFARLCRSLPLMQESRGYSHTSCPNLSESKSALL